MSEKFPPSNASPDRGDHADTGRPTPSANGSENWPDTDHPSLTNLRFGSPADQEAALARLFHAYSEPLRRHIRHHWPLLRQNDIDDLASEFMTLCLTGEKAHFLTYDAERNGSPVRLRSYLRALLDNFLRNHRRRNLAQSRGGDRHFESLDTIRPAAHQEAAPEDCPSANGLDIEAYDRHWAQHIISLSFVTLENGAPAIRDWLPILRPWILADPGEVSLKEIARNQGCSHDAVRTHLHRLRKTWRQAVRDTVARTVARPEDVDDELRHLAAVLARHPVE
jgi:RNA polymerase sigma-70 factor (ECF subfamily)